MDLSNLDFSNSKFLETDFSLSDLSKTSFKNGTVINCDFTGTRFYDTDFRGATIQGFRLSSGNLKGIIVDFNQITQLALEDGIKVKDTA
jgi:uncharacterized protein YjbI with pentapeptide repeats